MMTEPQNLFVHCMLIPLHQHYLLLPNSSIAEVIPKTGVAEQRSEHQDWLGFIDWQGEQLPVVHLEKLLNHDTEIPSAANKLCIINGINDEAGIASYAIPCSGSPQLITLNQSALHLTHDDNNSPYLHCQIKISNKVALIPNLDRLENTLREYQA